MKQNTSKVKIAIVDDHNLFRKGLIKLISIGDANERYEILFEAESGVELKEKLQQKLTPDIILLDLNMPEMDGFETMEWLRKDYPDIRILIISMLESEEAILKMIRLGVKGYLSKDIEVEDIHRALESISSNGFYYSDFVSGIMANTILEKSQPQKGVTRALHLTDKEKEFIALASTELTYHQIADKMNLSPKTIDGYREALFKKFKVKSRVGLVVYSIKKGLITIANT